MPKRKALYLIDGHALAYRTYFALPGAGGDPSRWITKRGEPTAGTYGFVSVLLRLLTDDQPDYLAVSFDVGRTFRDDLFAEYKGTREKMPDELHVQIERIKEIIAAFNIPLLMAEGFEADDVLGTVARRAVKAGVAVKIITGDRDLLQLADKHITINLAGQKLSEAVDYGPDEVKEKYGLTPKQYIDFKALVGDTSDNIPGVSGVGEKTATQLLQEHGSLDAIYKHLDQVPGRFRPKLEAGRESAYLSQRLATIVTDVDLAFDLEACRVGSAYDRERVFELFRQLEFNSLLKRLPGGEPAEPAPASAASAPTGPGAQMGLFPAEPIRAREDGPTRPIVVDDEASLDQLVQALSAAPGVAFDVETDSLGPMRAGLVGLSLAIQPGEGYYVPVGHAEGRQLALERVLERLRGPLTDARLPKFGHNINFDYISLARHGLRVAPLAFDTMLAEWLCDPASHSLGLKKLALVRLGVEMTEISELIGSGKKQITMAQVPVPAAAAYAAADADLTLRLVPGLRAELEQKQQLELFHNLEMPLIAVIADMEMAGIALDLDHLAAFSKELEQQLAGLEARIYELVGYAFNVNSTQQLAEALFERLQLKPPDKSRKTAAGKYSTAADVLEEMRAAHAHPVLDVILEQREIAKLKSTYVDALPLEVNPATGRVHTSYNQAGAVTGRLASSEPNLQNIPIRSELGRRVRRAFIAGPGQVLVSADYSQIELRIAAHMAHDETLLRAFLEGEDIHTATAAAVLGVAPAAVSKEQRRQAKAVNFGLLYGMGAFALSRQTGLTLAEAENFVKGYFERFPRIKQYLDETKRFAAEHGYVATLLGRRRYFPGFGQAAGSREAAIARARAEREAINAPIQGTAADIVKRAMLALPEALAAAGLSARLLLQVHDELVLECPKKEVKAAARVLRAVMEGAFQLDVPLGVDVRSGANWDDLTPVPDR